MTGGLRIRRTGSIAVALPPSRAFTLFTPSGERTWAAGWDPGFPVAPADETEPGVVFVTRHGDRLTTWTVVARDPGRAIRYAQFTPGHRAGLVSVTVLPAGAGRDAGSTVTVVDTASGLGLVCAVTTRWKRAGWRALACE